jgi:hypothetical protein
MKQQVGAKLATDHIEVRFGTHKRVICTWCVIVTSQGGNLVASDGTLGIVMHLSWLECYKRPDLRQ